MRKHVLRALLGTGYVLLLTALLLYQAGAFGERREWTVAVVGTLFLGAALAVVFVRYLRMSDRIEELRDVRGKEQTGQAGDMVAAGVREAGEQSEADVRNSRRQEAPVSGGSYEEIYAHFLAVMETCTLSERELEVAWLLYRGYTNRQIGEALYIAETTVKKHVSHIYQKMDVCSRKEFRAKVQDGALARSHPGG